MRAGSALRQRISWPQPWAKGCHPEGGLQEGLSDLNRRAEEMKSIRTLKSWQGAKATVTGYSVLGRGQESPRPGGTDHIRGDSGRGQGTEGAI